VPLGDLEIIENHCNHDLHQFVVGFHRGPANPGFTMDAEAEPNLVVRA
jgi:hypothetical protein